MSDRTLLIEVLVALGAGRVTLRPIHSDGELVYGCCEKGGAVTINPAIDVCDSALHELIHRLRPRWTETRVRRQTKRLMNSLTAAEMDTIYAQVQVVAKVRKRPMRMDVD